MVSVMSKNLPIYSRNKITLWIY